MTMPEQFCTMYEKCKFPEHGLYLIFDTGKCVNMKQECSSLISNYSKTHQYYILQSGMVWQGKLSW